MDENDMNDGGVTPTGHPDSNSRSSSKQSVRVTRSDPLSCTSNKSHLIRSKHNHHHPQSASACQKPSSSSNGSHHSRERRARWIRDRMSGQQNQHNNQRRESSSDERQPSHQRQQKHHTCYGCCEQPTSQTGTTSTNTQSNGDTFSDDFFAWTKFNSGLSRQDSNWISENDSKASRFHRPYSVREQSSFANNQNPTDLQHQYRNRHQRLCAGRSLPSQCISFQEEGDPLTQAIITPRIETEISFLDEEEEEGEHEEEDTGGTGSLLRRKYCLKRGHSRGGANNHRLGEPLREIERRSRSGSPCSITSESTESVGDCENALDPPHLTLPNGSLDNGGQAVPVTCGLPRQYSGGGGANGRKFSVLFYSNEAWSEDNIVHSFRELSPVATSVFEAAWTGNREALEDILRDEANLERLRDTSSAGFRDGEFRTPLHLAGANGHVDCVRLLLEKGAPVNAIDGSENKATPLSCAASCGALPVLQVLLDAGADVNAGYEQGKTALHWAVQAGNVESAKLLLEAGAKQNPPQVYSETPLHVASSQGDEDCLKLLLDFGADVNLCKGSSRSTALHLSAEEGSAACIRLLIKAGASHAAKDIRGHSALHVAATCDADCVIALLKAGADPNAVDANGRTPLHCAVARGSRAAECVRLLVENGADIDAQDNYGYTPLHLSAVNESSQCAKILLHHGSDVTLKTNAGTNALSLLVRRIPDVMRYLVDRLDNAVTIHDHDPGDPDCEVRLDFRAIVPNCEKRHTNGTNHPTGKNGHIGGGGTAGGSDRRKQDYFSKPHKETEFLTCLVAAGNKKILAHPLSEAFLTLKWRRVRKFFWASLLFQIALVALFTIYVVEVYLIRCPYRRPPGHNHSDEDIGEAKKEGRSETSLVMIPPQPKPPYPVPGAAHNLTRRSADASPQFSWFGIEAPRPKGNRSRSSKKTRNDDDEIMPMPAPPGPEPPTEIAPPTKRSRGRVNIIIGSPPPAPAAAPATGFPPPPDPHEDSSEERTPRMEPIHCRLSPSLSIIWILLVTFTSLMAIKEIFQLLQSPLSYVVSSENWGQWLLISSVSLTAWSTPEFQLEYWQYPAAACGIFLAWGLMLLQVGRFPALGLYVQMLGKVAANFGLFILAYACLLIAFALAFCVLFPEHEPFSSVAKSILKVFTMMVGEVEYEALFYDKERPPEPILFPITAHLLYGTFVVIVTIVLMNLLVGLAVHDIQGLQKGAKLNRLSRQTALISRLESFIFSKKLQSVMPRTLGSLLQKSALLVPSSYNWSFYFRPNDPRDKRLPKDIKQASLRLAAIRHSGSRSKSPLPPRPPTTISTPGHRNTRPAISSNNTPVIPVVRPVSSVSHHASAMLPQHPEVVLRRLEQRLDNMQKQLEKVVSLLGAVKLAAGSDEPQQLSARSSRRRPHMLSVRSSQKSQSDCDNDHVFLEEGMILARSTSISPCSSVVMTRPGSETNQDAKDV